jgi:hypothetical protein
MSIRTATIKDVKVISHLLEQLGYVTKIPLLKKQLKASTKNKGYQVLVYELAGEVTGFCTVHFILQLGFEESLAIISLLSVKSLRAAKELEAHVTHLAYERNCGCVRVCGEDLLRDDHKFYAGQGYGEHQVYLSKRLVYPETKLAAIA